jgi:hypothetical protein
MYGPCAMGGNVLGKGNSDLDLLFPGTIFVSFDKPFLFQKKQSDGVFMLFLRIRVIGEM